ncbi:MAG: ABC transporter ATP-binding protein [Candidatus Moraniibacteriota bacterium]|nr:MAG: ABC transporter ATP-binding protein [Candidatus Moranbacteria bacterium]
MEPIVKVRDLSVIYNQGKPNEFHSLKGVSANVYPEEFTIIFGPSGCGKSTLLYAMSALQKPTSGDVMVYDSIISEAGFKEQAIFRQMTVGMIFQSFYLIPSLHVLDNVCLPRVFRGEKRADRRKIGMQLLERFGIAEQAEKYPNQLSGGQKQRVAIARSLINDPVLILADEPVGNLDSRSAENVMEILQDLKEIDKKAVVLVTHDPSHLEQADRIFSMRDGKIIDEKVQKGKRHQKKVESQEVRPEEEEISNELRLLLRTFKNMPREYAANLLNPYKANQWLNYVLREISEEQFSLAESSIQEFLMGAKNTETLRESLDRDCDAGGAGWDKRRAISISERMRRMMNVSKKIREGATEENALFLLQYLTGRFTLQFTEETSNIMLKALRERIGNTITPDQLQEIFDRDISLGGVGMYRATASHVMREIEMLMLLGY